jgi:hypothetical protein
MFQWWQSLESVATFNGWMQVMAVIGAAATTICIIVLYRNGNRMIRNLMDREQHATKRIKAVEAAAEQIRKELLSTQQNHDIADQKRRLAEMDADALRKEMDKIRRRYTEAEGELKNRIDELKDMAITQGKDSVGQTEGMHLQFDDRQIKMLSKLLNSGPKGELDIIAVLDNPQSNRLANQFKSIFDGHGWITPGIVQSAFSSPPEGVVLVIRSKQTAPSYAKFLQRTLTSVGLPVSVQINNKYREWSISMIVGQVG